MPQMISLREWDPTGTLGPAPGVRAKEELPMELINMFMGMAQQKQASNQARKQDSVYRDAIKAEMGMDVPEGMGDKLYPYIQQEKIKAELDPNKGLNELLTKGKAADAARTLGDRGMFEAIVGQGAQPAAQTIPQAGPQPVPQVTPQSQPAADPLKSLYEQAQQIDQFTGKPTAEAAMASDQLSAKQKATEAAEKERQVNASKVKRLSTLADAIEQNWRTTQPGSGPAWRFLGAGKDIVGKGLQLTENQRNDESYRSFVRGVRAQLARAMGDVGNLSEPEQKAAMELVPTLFDDRATGEKKLQMLRNLVQAITAGNTDDASSILSQGGQSMQSLPEGVTEEDIAFTMQKHGVSREEVLKRISGGM